MFCEVLIYVVIVTTNVFGTKHTYEEYYTEEAKAKDRAVFFQTSIYVDKVELIPVHDAGQCI